MMDTDRLIEYDKWANTKIYDSIKELPEGELKKECFRLFAHLLSAQVVWLQRINSGNVTQTIWPEPNTKQIESMMENNPDKLRTSLKHSGKMLSYKNSKGDVFLNKVDEIITHLIVHGQHHRAQIALLLRQNDYTPPATDLIFYLRTNHQ